MYEPPSAFAPCRFAPRRSQLHTSTTSYKTQPPVCVRRRPSNTDHAKQSVKPQKKPRPKTFDNNHKRARPIQAIWSGHVIAQSTKYEFMDGRFFFPVSSVNWELVEKTEKTRHHNPIGKMGMHDIVIPLSKKHGKVLRNRAAVFSFQKLKRQFERLQGYTCFWKGVRIVAMDRTQQRRRG
ncbi:unnamed protein product [Agarophyton chilense]